jgi:hypothetical protein
MENSVAHIWEVKCSGKHPLKRTEYHKINDTCWPCTFGDEPVVHL